MSDYPGTAAWLRDQWSNPTDIFTILLIIGGDVVQVAIAQLCAGPVLGLAPVTFSFGWVSYAVSAALSAVGENRLMPKPDLSCLVINAKSGYARDNNSWVLSRILRDFEHWMGPEERKKKVNKLVKLKEKAKQENNHRAAKLQEAQDNNNGDEIERISGDIENQRSPEDVRIALRLSVWKTVGASGRATHDWVYWLGIMVIIVQFVIAAIPWGLYREWLTFLITVSGTLLALASSALPQWKEEKLGVRIIKKAKDKKDVYLIVGNGAQDAILIRGRAGDIDLEALASPERELKSQLTTRIMSIVLAFLWIALLISVAGHEEHTWYLLGVGILGILHNILVAGCPRTPKAFGIDLKYEDTIMEGKVMEVLWAAERRYPQAGAALLPTMFPGKLRHREESLWVYAEITSKARKQVAANPSEIWELPPLYCVEDPDNTDDIPKEGKKYDPTRPGSAQDRVDKEPQTVAGAHDSANGYVIDMPDADLPFS